MGQGYILACPPGGEQLLHAAVADVDREMSAIRDTGKLKARERIAVLAALNLAYQLAELRREMLERAAPPTSAPAPSTLREDAGPGEIDALVRRLDQVLGQDGHLL